MSTENKTEEVNAFLQQLEHPLKAEIEAVRAIIKANRKICERVKWNAPSFFYVDDLATIHVKAKQHVHLIFHHPAIVNMKEVKARKKELTRIINELVDLME